MHATKLLISCGIMLLAAQGGDLTPETSKAFNFAYSCGGDGHQPVIMDCDLTLEVTTDQWSTAKASFTGSKLSQSQANDKGYKLPSDKFWLARTASAALHFGDEDPTFYEVIKTGGLYANLLLSRYKDDKGVSREAIFVSSWEPEDKSAYENCYCLLS